MKLSEAYKSIKQLSKHELIKNDYVLAARKERDRRRDKLFLIMIAVILLGVAIFANQEWQRNIGLISMLFINIVSLFI